jgi:hypothetical protein
VIAYGPAVQSVPRGPGSQTSRVHHLTEAACLIASELHTMQILAGFKPSDFAARVAAVCGPGHVPVPAPLPTPVRVGTTTSTSYIRAHCSLRSSARVRRGGQGARSFTEGFARIGSPMGMGVAQMWAMPQGLRGCTRYKSGLKVRRPFVDHVASVRHRSHKLVSAIVAF